MSIIYRETTQPQFRSTNDFVTLGDYDNSFKTAPKLSQLRMAIAPGTVKHFNNVFQTGNIVPLQDQMRYTDRPLTHFSAVVSDNEALVTPNYKPDGDCEYTSYPKNNRKWL